VVELALVFVAVLRQHKQLKEDLEKREESESSFLEVERQKAIAELTPTIEALRAENSQLQTNLAQLSLDKSTLTTEVQTKEAELAILTNLRAKLEDELREAEEKVKTLDVALQEEKLSKKLMLDAMSMAPAKPGPSAEEDVFGGAGDTSAVQEALDSDLDIRNIEREDGEGSECVSASPPGDSPPKATTSTPTPIFKYLHGDSGSIDESPRSPTKLMPLDKLLVADEAEYDR
jgi:hypothetical protein